MNLSQDQRSTLDLTIKSIGFLLVEISSFVYLLIHYFLLKLHKLVGRRRLFLTIIKYVVVAFASEAIQLV